MPSQSANRPALAPSQKDSKILVRAIFLQRALGNGAGLYYLIARDFQRGRVCRVSSCTCSLTAAQTDLAEVKRKTRRPVYLGSGVAEKNPKQLFPLADGFI